MHPLSTIMLVLGYFAAIPLATQIVSIVMKQRRIAMVGHQAAFLVVALGWTLRKWVYVALIHGMWLVGTRLWFEIIRRRTINP